jgi:predicted transcriptional regulator YdeE
LTGASITAVTNTLATKFFIAAPEALELSNKFLHYALTGGLAATAEGITEMAENVLHDLSNLMTNPESKVNWNAAKDAGEIGAYVGATVQTIVNAALHIKANKQKSEFEKLQTAGGEQGLKQKSPETYAKFSDEVAAHMANTTDGPITDVYIDRNTFKQALTDNKIDPVAVGKAIPSITDQVNSVDITGDIVIPMNDWIGKVIGTDVGAVLFPHARGSVNAPSLGEVQQATAMQPEMSEQILAAIAKKQLNDDFVKSAQEVQDIMFQQLKQTGRYADPVSRINAQLVRDFVVTQAANQNIMPMDFYNKYMYKVTAEGQAAFQQKILEGKDWITASQKEQKVDVIGNQSAIEETKTEILSSWMNQNLYKNEASPNIFEILKKENADLYFDVDGDLTDEGNSRYVDIEDNAADKLAKELIGEPTKKIDYSSADYVAELLNKYAEDLGLSPYAISGSRLSGSKYFELNDGTQIRVSDHELPDHYQNNASIDIVLDGQESTILDAMDRIKILSRNGETRNLLRQSLSTRLPSSVKATEDPMAEVLNINFDVTMSDEVTLAKNVKVLQKTVNFRKLKGAGAKDVKRNVESIIDHMVSNLLFLHDSFPAEMRERAELWYDGGRKTAEEWANRYGISEMQAASAIAVLSPQNGWFVNVSSAERIADIIFGMQSFVWDSAMTKEAKKIPQEKPEDKARMKMAKGKSLGEVLNDPEIAARWIRVFDQTHNNRSYRILTPEGGVSDYVTIKDGKDATMAWKSFGAIAKAVSILTDGTASNTFYQIGQEHKVRNFYNNLFDPNSPLGFATIDTHAVAAANLRPLAAQDDEVTQAFGGAGSSSSSNTGLNGTYPIIHEAYRRAAEARGMLPRQMQSITWEAARGLFEASKKSGMKAEANAIWSRYKSGEIDQEQAQKEIFTLAGGITPPSWSKVPFNDTVGRTYEGASQKAIDAIGNVGAKPNPVNVLFEVMLGTLCHLPTSLEFLKTLQRRLSLKYLKRSVVPARFRQRLAGTWERQIHPCLYLLTEKNWL